MRLPIPRVASVRDFYAFEQHVATCRKARGLEMTREWYQVPVFYFSNPAGVIGHNADVAAPSGSVMLDYELELACIIGKTCRDVPADDRAWEYVAGFTIMNDWSAATFSASKWRSASARAKGKISPRRSVPSLSRATNSAIMSATAACILK